MYPRRLDVDAAFTNCFGKSCYAAVVTASTSIELDFAHPSGLGSLGDHLTNFGSRFTIGPIATNRLVQSRSRRDGPARLVVNQLTREMLQRSLNAQAWTFGTTANLISNAECPTLALVVNDLLKLHGTRQNHRKFKLHARPTAGLLGRRLTWLQLDLLALVANSLTLVGLGLSERSDLSRKLANLLLVATANNNVGLIGAGHL